MKVRGSCSGYETFIKSTKLGENAYRLLRDRSVSSGYKFVRVSDEKDYFDEAAHRYCEATEAQGDKCDKDKDCYTGQCVPSSDGSSNVCCSSACNKTCQVCSANGAECRNAKYGQRGSGCTKDTQFCDGDKMCRVRASVENGGACKGTLECKSGFCADGVCCNSKCDGTCLSCNQSGKLGMCTLVERDKRDDDTCVSHGMSCNGAGECKTALRFTCSNGRQCVSNICKYVAETCIDPTSLKARTPCGMVCFPR